MSKYPNWSTEELELLSIKYPTLGKCKELQDLFPTRNLSAVCLKASRLGLKVLNNIRAGRTNEEYLTLLESTNFVALEEYQGSTEPILHMCGICDYEWEARPQQLLRIGAKCPICSHKDRMLPIDTINNILSKSDLTRLSEYTGSLDKLLVQHNTCGHEWWTVYSYIEQGSGCPKCNRGFGYLHNKKDLPSTATLYLFKLNIKGIECLKVGITCRPIKLRTNELNSSISKSCSDFSVTLMHSIEDSGKSILEHEWELLSKYPRFNTEIRFIGQTELVPLEYLHSIISDMNKFVK